MFCRFALLFVISVESNAVLVGISITGLFGRTFTSFLRCVIIIGRFQEKCENF